jgi:branched-chain amino acid transport system ATP-binding protein
MENTLIVDGAAKRFGGVTALSGAGLRARSKEINAIIGPNGAGKTTLINIISGVYPPDDGSVTLNGEVLNGLRSSQVARKGIARTFQNVALFSGMSVVQNILLGRNMLMTSGVLKCAMFWGAARREEVEHRRHVEEIIDFLNLTDIRNSLAGSLPLGLKKRVELGRALAAGPKVLLLDEPMGGMNIEEKEDMCRYVLDVVELTDTAVILIEHDMGVVMDISDYVVVLDQGTKIGEGTPAEVRSNQAVIDAYLGASH